MKNNQISVEGIVGMVKMVYDDDATRIKLAADIASECVGVTDSDPCEAASKALDCMVHAHEAHGLKMGDW